MWHYPFLDYTRPHAWAAYLALPGALCGAWMVGCRLCERAAAASTSALARKPKAI